MSEQPYTGASVSTALRRAVPYLVLGLFLLWTFVPIVWMFLSSLKYRREFFEFPPTLVFEPTLRNYEVVLLGANSVANNLVNSLVVAVASAAIAVVFGTIGGYGLSRIDLRGKKHLAFWIISTRMAPIAAVVVPLFYIFRFLGLINTHLGLVIAYSTFNVPFAIWLTSTFFDDIPEAIEEAAIVDGATRWEAFRYVALPLAAPGIAAAGIIALIFAWNDFLFALIFTGNETQTLPVAMASMETFGGVLWGLIMAAGVIVLIPVTLFGVVVRKYIVSGLSMGAVKQ